MQAHSSKLLAISLLAVLGAAVFLTHGNSGHDGGILGGATEARAANAIAVDSSKSANVAGDKAWEVLDGPVKIGTAKASAEAKATTATASAPMGRFPW